MTVIQGNGFVAEIIRSPKRKTSAIKIQKGQVFIMVPERLSMAIIEYLVTEKTRWIKEKLALHQEIFTIKPKEFVSGEAFSYLGKQYRLKIETGLYPTITRHSDDLVVSVRDKAADNSKVIKQMLIKWYKQQADSGLRQKTESYSRIIGVKPSSVIIKSFKARWGSCSTIGGIQYNWKIIIAPDSVINYVVIHELCHILHHNHSPLFWKAVERYCHDYRDCGAWLKINGARLDV
jgi:predicted metal-dependent hydrolase